MKILAIDVGMGTQDILLYDIEADLAVYATEKSWIFT